MRSKLFLTVLMICLCGLFACNIIEEGDKTFFEQPCCDGDTVLPPEPGLTDVTVVILADQSIGREGFITIYRRWENSDEMIVDLPIVINNGAQFGFSLEPGDNYWMAVTGKAFTSYQEFAVQQDQPQTIVLQMYEWPLITWYASLNAASPGGQTVPQLDQEVMRFNLWHNWPEALRLRLLNFNVMYTLNLEVTACSLYALEPASGDWIFLGTAAEENYNVQFNADLGTLGYSIIPPNAMGIYSLHCDVWGYGPNADILQTELNGLLGYPDNIEQDVQSLPITGNMLAY